MLLRAGRREALFEQALDDELGPLLFGVVVAISCDSEGDGVSTPEKLSADSSSMMVGSTMMLSIFKLQFDSINYSVNRVSSVDVVVSVTVVRSECNA